MAAIRKSEPTRYESGLIVYDDPLQSAARLRFHWIFSGSSRSGAHVTIRESDRPLMHLVVSVGAAPLTMVELVGE